MADQDPNTHVACGEPPLSPELKDALTLLRERSDNDEFRALLDDVLAGRCSLFDASTTEAFGAAVFAPVAQDFTERLSQMTDEEKQALAQEDHEAAALCADLHRRTLDGDAAAAESPCGTCTRLCSAPCSTPPE